MTETQIIHIGRPSKSGARIGDGRAETDPLDTLFAEISNYLEAVVAFRREGHEPTWRAEVSR